MGQIVRLPDGQGSAEAGITINTFFAQMKTYRTHHKELSGFMDQNFHWLFHSGSMASTDTAGFSQSASTSVWVSVDAFLQVPTFVRLCAHSLRLVVKRN